MMMFFSRATEVDISLQMICPFITKITAPFVCLMAPNTDNKIHIFPQRVTQCTSRNADCLQSVSTLLC